MLKCWQRITTYRWSVIGRDRYILVWGRSPAQRTLPSAIVRDVSEGTARADIAAKASILATV